MILVDASVWIDHLRSTNAELQALLQEDQVLTHPFIRLEMALGSIADRQKLLADLALLPQTPVLKPEELFSLIDRRKLYRRGIGITDLQLLGCALLDRSIFLWTRDRRLGKLADELKLRAPLP